MKPPRFAAPVALALALAVVGISCSALKDFTQAITNVSRCKFKVDHVSDFTFAGIALEGKRSFGFEDGLKLLPAFTSKKFPATFIVNVAAVNPNDGSGGTTSSTATLRNFAWTLLIDDVTTISGDLAAPVSIPGTGQQAIIPLRMELDLYSFFEKRGYDGMLNLALALGGVGKSSAHVKLKARPTIDTRFGPISYPGELTIVDTEFRSE
jgi:hypothetical protein